MITWRDFQQKASKRRGWTPGVGEAKYADHRARFTAEVMVAVPANSLDPSRVRHRLSLSHEPPTYEIRTSSEKGGNDLRDLRAFSAEWEALWRSGCACKKQEAAQRIPRFNLARLVPEGFVPPVPLDFPPHIRQVFPSYEISRTPLAPLWGQSCDRLGGEGKEVFAGKIASARCPFCSEELEESSEYVIRHLDATDAEYYGVDPPVLTCPSCTRILDVAA